MQTASIDTNDNTANAQGATAAAGPGTAQFERARKQGLRAILIGLGLFGIGVAVTVATYALASSSPSGGTYFVAFGPIIFGPIIAFRGFIALLRLRKLSPTVRPVA